MRFRIVVVIVFGGLAIGLPLSPWGIAYVTAWCTWLVAPLGKTKPRITNVRRFALLVAATTLLFRTFLGAELSGDGLGVLSEADIAIPVATALPLVEPDAMGLRTSMTERYRAMRADVGEPPIPVFHSWAGRNATLRLNVDNPQLGVVFLHGYAGNFALPCWHVARAAREVGGATRCPSSGFAARWRSVAKVRHEIRELRDLGADTIVLAGISAGAIGASRLAPRLRRDIDGLMLLAGVSRRAGRPGVPVLTIGGRRDSMTSPTAIRRYGRRHGQHLELEGGHFALLEEHEVAHDTMVQWLNERVRAADGRRASGRSTRRRSRR